MALRRLIDKSLVEEMARLRGEGLSIKRIAAIVGVDPRRVSENLVIRGVRGTSKTISSEELQKKREEGMFLHEISKLYGISISVIKGRTKPPKVPNRNRYNPNRPSEEKLEAIRQLRLTNLSCSEISKRTGRSISLVKEICAGIKIERKNLKTKLALLGAENREKVLSLRAEGKTIEHIAGELSLGVSTVKKHLRDAGLPGFDPKKNVCPDSLVSWPKLKTSKNYAAPKVNQVKKAFIHTVIGIAVGAKTKLSIPDHVRRMCDSLVMSRGYTEEKALAQAMNFYARGKVTSRDDDYQPRKIVIRRRES